MKASVNVFVFMIIMNRKVLVTQFLDGMDDDVAAAHVDESLLVHTLQLVGEVQTALTYHLGHILPPYFYLVHNQPLS